MCSLSDRPHRHRPGCEFDYSGSQPVKRSGRRATGLSGQFQSGHDHDGPRYGRQGLRRAPHTEVIEEIIKKESPTLFSRPSADRRGLTLRPSLPRAVSGKVRRRTHRSRLPRHQKSGGQGGIKAAIEKIGLESRKAALPTAWRTPARSPRRSVSLLLFGRATRSAAPGRRLRTTWKSSRHLP